MCGIMWSYCECYGIIYMYRAMNLKSKKGNSQWGDSLSIKDLRTLSMEWNGEWYDIFYQKVTLNKE